MARNDEDWGPERENVRVGGAGDIYVYKIKELELHILEKGTSGSADLNVALALVPAAVALFGSLHLCPSDADWVRNIFLFLAAGFLFLGVGALFRWYPTKGEVARVVKEIKDRAEDDSA